MTCLNDAQVQAVVDNEAAEDLRAHATSCARCARRLDERRRLNAAAVHMLDIPAPLPPGLERQIAQVLASSHGATRLRESAPAAGLWRRTAWSAVVVTVATLAVVLFIVPMFKGPATVSAAAILAKSADRLAETASTGFELLEYELIVDGMPREMMPDQTNGTYRISQVIDHNSPGHFRYTSFAPDGRMLSSIAEDPSAHRRVSLMRIDNQRYRFEFTMPDKGLPSLPEIERLHMQATVAMMQASGQQVLQTVDGPDGPLYRIEVPQVSADNISAVWDLNHAQVLIDAKDFRITEFSASGTLLKQPYSISYRLIAHTVVSAVQPEVFVVPSEPGEIVLAGDGTASPTSDVFFASLRELARMKAQR
jgi:hypothetical protein